MRISRLIASLALLGVAVWLSPAISFDGTRAPEAGSVPLPENIASPAAGSTSLGTSPVAPLALSPRAAMPPTPLEALRSGTQACLRFAGRGSQTGLLLCVCAAQCNPFRGAARHALPDRAPAPLAL